MLMISINDFANHLKHPQNVLSDAELRVFAEDVLSKLCDIHNETTDVRFGMMEELIEKYFPILSGGLLDIEMIFKYQLNRIAEHTTNHFWDPRIKVGMTIIRPGKHYRLACINMDMEKTYQFMYAEVMPEEEEEIDEIVSENPTQEQMERINAELQLGGRT